MIDLRRELEASRQEAKKLSAENVRLASVVRKTTAENERLSSTVLQTSKVISQVKSKMYEVRAELEGLRRLAVSTQDPLIRVFLYKLVMTKAFNDYINTCVDALNPATTTDTIKLISMVYPELEIKKATYGYNEEAKREQDGFRLRPW